MAFNFSAVSLDWAIDRGRDLPLQGIHRSPQRSRRNATAAAATTQTQRKQTPR
jgi:hypothetical protein